MRRAFLTLAVLAVAVASYGDWVVFTRVSVTADNQYVRLPVPRAEIMLCNYGANDAHYRLFGESETVGAATTAYATLVAGSATAPVCKSVTKGPTVGEYLKVIALVCDTAETATVEIEVQ